MAGDFEWTAYLEEYKNLTDEIKRRVSYQLIVIGGNITFTSAVIGALADKFDVGHLTIILLLPLVSFIIVWLFLEQDVFVTQPARYLHQVLRPALVRLIEKDVGGRATDSPAVMGWEAYRHELLFDPASPYRGFFGQMWRFRYFATIGPGLALLITAGYIAWYNPGGVQKLAKLQVLLFAVDTLRVILCFVVPGKVEKYYRAIAG
jgi:hypothetical protein